MTYADLYLAHYHQTLTKLAYPADAAFTAPVTSHTVAPGETLSGIAKRYGTDTNAMVAANKGTVSDPELIQRGSGLNVPPPTPLAAPSLGSTIAKKLKGFAGAVNGLHRPRTSQNLAESVLAGKKVDALTPVVDGLSQKRREMVDFAAKNNVPFDGVIRMENGQPLGKHLAGKLQIGTPAFGRFLQKL